MKLIRTFGCLTFLILIAGCPSTGSEVNPFLVYTESFGLGTAGSGLDSEGGQGIDLPLPFRRELNLAFVNTHPTDELNVSFVAWVSLSSITSAQQQDALIESGYVQLTRQVELGTAFTLPVGTFVYNGGGTAGATAVLLGSTGAVEATEGGEEGEDSTPDPVLPTSQTYSLLTPDAILAFAQPPVSCDSVAFYFTDQGDVLVGDGLFQGATASGPYKTFAQVDVYQCDPLRPGLFLNLSGASTAPNEYMEGQNIVFQFNPTSTPAGDYATVTITDSQ